MSRNNGSLISKEKVAAPDNHILLKSALVLIN